MLTPAQRDQIVSILDAADDLTVATVRPDGWPQATTVSFVNDGMKIYFGAWSKSQKTQNITRDPRVSITVNAPYKSWDKIRGVSLAGRARRVQDTQEMQRIFTLMVEKFPQIGQFVKGGADVEMALFCVEPSVVSVLDYSQGFGHAELMSA